MHPRAAEFTERAREAHGVEWTVEEFPEGTKTAEDAAAAVGCAVDRIASSLVFDVDGDLVCHPRAVNENRRSTCGGQSAVSRALRDLAVSSISER